jgi:hypothetical protein
MIQRERPSKLSTAEAEAAKLLSGFIEDATVGSELSKLKGFGNLIYPLMFLIPILCEEQERGWRRTGIDDLRFARAVLLEDAAVELVGSAQRVADQEWMAFRLLLRPSSTGDFFSETAVSVGEVDVQSGELILLSSRSPKLSEYTSALPARVSEIYWKYSWT